MGEVAGAIKKVLGNPRYALLALAIGVFVFAMAVWMPNLGLLFSVIADPSTAVSQKIALPLNLLGSITTNFSALSASYTIAIAVLFGVNAAMVVYFLKRRRADVQGSGMAAGAIGMISGAFGVGCAACGSFLLTSILSSFGAASALFLLPLRGGEFGILGVILLGISTVLVAKQITNPLVCNP